jgi:hypothetical protein
MKLSPFKRGDTWRIIFAWKNDGVAINLTDCQAKMQIRKKRTGTLLAEITDADGITITGLTGELEAAFPASMTADIEVGTHETSIQVTFPSGDVQSSDSIDIPVIEAVTR